MPGHDTWELTSGQDIILGSLHLTQNAPRTGQAPDDATYTNVRTRPML
jgi:hypothetical protein